jgi:beta-galactosidase
MNTKELFNDGWEFAKSELHVTEHTGLSFEQVDIPHDWLIYDTLALYENNVGWYRKKWACADTGGDRQFLLCFDGVYMDCSVYVNGQFIGEWKYGYSSFELEITGAVVEGDNEVIVKVVHQSPNSRWYSGAGIYRNVWLKERNRNYIDTDGVYVATKQQSDRWLVEIETNVHIEEDVLITHQILFEDLIVAYSSDRVSVASSNSITNNRQTLTINNPLLWSPDEPILYRIVTRMQMEVSLPTETEIQRYEDLEILTLPLGFRNIVLDAEFGLQVNGKKLKLNGVCEHHDLGALGAAFNVQALRRRFVILKEMGVNAIRTAHNMPAPELMDLADEMGLFVVSEAFDMWERSKTAYDYARFFKDWAYRDVQSWVLRDRNHPSLLMWSIGNEIYDTHVDERGQEVTRMLMEYVLEFDPKQNARVTIGSNYMPWENAQKCAEIVKVAGYNYAEKYYAKHHEEHPDWIIYGSETASVVQSRGIYHFPFEKSILADDDEQCSALGNSSTSWGAKSAEACIIAERDTPFSLGQFLWTGFDYIGEPTPYHTKNSYFGQIDTATFKKDSYYIYQAAWTDYRTNPMVHIFPYWDFNEGQIIDVRVCSNAPKVELQLNGTTIGTHDIDHEHGTQLVGWWKVPYMEGEIKAIAYDETGKVIATDVQSSFGNVCTIHLQADKEALMANGTDLIFVEIGMLDSEGQRVENANNRVHVEVTGEGRLLGLDNGDSTDYDSYKGKSRRLFSGKLMAIIGATLKPGPIRIEVSSEGMKTEVMEFAAQPVKGEIPKGISTNTRNHERQCVTGSYNEIPLRKLEIISDTGQDLDESIKEISVRAKLWPDNASYRDVEWRVVTDEGIDSNIARLEVNGLEAKISAIGDGIFRLRCTSKNGTDKTKLISQLEFKATGLGKAFKNPYGFITAGLYDYSKGDIGNGNERGIATSRDGETHVGFRDIDFGPYGSDTITIPIFALSSEEYAIQIWEGMPGVEHSSLVADVIYQKPSKWNVYQEATYRLTKRLRGITSLCFVLRQKVHIRGFSFEPQNQAFADNSAASCDRIYGDTFAIVEGRVEGIGNNVSLEFTHMEFTSEGTSKLVINGRSPIDKNTIHIRFAGENGESSQLVEFEKSDGYEERVFELAQVIGLQKVTFIFLPGSNFDFNWFRFMPIGD